MDFFSCTGGREKGEGGEEGRRRGGEDGSPRLCQGLLFGVVALIHLCLDIPSTVKILI